MHKVLTLIICLSLLAIGSTAIADRAITPEGINAQLHNLLDESPNDITNIAIQEYLNSLIDQRIFGRGTSNLIGRGNYTGNNYLIFVNTSNSSSVSIRYVPKTVGLQIKKCNKIWFAGVIKSVTYYDGFDNDYFILIDVEYDGIVLK